jgi:hypothetical protein
MTGQEKETVSQLLASLFCPPDQEMVKQIRKGVTCSFLQRCIGFWGGI